MTTVRERLNNLSNPELLDLANGLRYFCPHCDCLQCPLCLDIPSTLEVSHCLAIAAEKIYYERIKENESNAL